MMDIKNNIFRGKKVSEPKLSAYGFSENNGMYSYHTVLHSSGLSMVVEIMPDGLVKATILDRETKDPYTLHLTDGAMGSFVTSVKMEYEQVLTDIAEKCFEPDIFKSAQAKAAIAYVRKTYGDKLEFLWAKFPNNAVWRRKDTRKWYGAILTVSRRKLGLPSDEEAEIMDLRIEPEQMDATVDNKKYFPGWHMNKRNWYTVILDGSVPTEELCHRIDRSYRLAIK
ncbi:MAG TPA: MmcQ/YjbR family DNA-binding protein [Firmicutes bacterium]|nr:MmcQ/YjbR family DNA-binding protein [Bacillota bacterium]